MTRLKCLLLSPGGTGGINSQVHLLANSLRRRNVKIALYKTTFPQLPKLLSVILRLVAFPFVLIAVRPSIAYLPLASKGSTYRKVIYSWILRIFRVRYIVHIHGGSFLEFYQQSHSRVRKLIRKLFTGASRILILHEGQRRIVSEISLPDSIPVNVFPNGVEVKFPPNVYHPPIARGILRVAFVGDVVKRKGVLDILALKDFFSENSIRIEFVGEPSDEVQKLLASIETENEDTFKFLGKLSHSDTLNVISRSHLLILPSYIENFPNVILEAFSLGVPALASDVGGIKEILSQGQNGWLIGNHGDRVANLRCAFEEALGQIPRLPEFSAKARITSERDFNIEKLSAKFQHYLESAGSIEE